MSLRHVVCIRYIRHFEYDVVTLTRNRPPCNTIWEKENLAVRLDSLPYSNRGGCDVGYIRRNSDIRS